MMLNNFLITGCAGFIGSHVVDVFHGKGHNVIGVDKLTYAGNNLPPYIKNYNIDICETELVAKACLDIATDLWPITVGAYRDIRHPSED